MRLQAEQLLLSASDLSGHLGCQHRTQLDRRAAIGQLRAPPPDPMLAVLQARGLAHEKAYIEHLRGVGAFRNVDLAGAPLDADGALRNPSSLSNGPKIPRLVRMRDRDHFFRSRNGEARSRPMGVEWELAATRPQPGGFRP